MFVFDIKSQLKRTMSADRSTDADEAPPPYVAPQWVKDGDLAAGLSSLSARLSVPELHSMKGLVGLLLTCCGCLLCGYVLGRYGLKEIVVLLIAAALALCTMINQDEHTRRRAERVGRLQAMRDQSIGGGGGGDVAAAVAAGGADNGAVGGAGIAAGASASVPSALYITSLCCVRLSS